ncbi:RNase H domain-containing protein [Trichonephila clavipes]|nr:RNase H domain-containing protein [Trichonephila clavipes]
MVWTISLEEFLINGSILQGSKDLRLSNLIVKSEKNSIWIIPPWSSFRSPSFQKTHQRIPVSNWNCCSHVPKKKKEDPVTLRQKGLETIAILSQDNFAIAYTDGSSDRSLSNGGAGIILLLPDGNNYKRRINTGIIASNFTSELVAIREALILYQQNPHVIDSTEGLVIFSDSKSAIEAIRNGETNISCDIITLLEQLHNKRKSCILQWIPAHVNIEVTEFDCPRIITSTIARLRTEHLKGMKIHPDKTRSYVQCKHCPDLQLTPNHILECPTVATKLLKMGMVPLRDSLRELLYSPDAPRIAEAVIKTFDGI